MMKKKLVSLLLALTLCGALVLPAFAEQTEEVPISGEIQISQEEPQNLNEKTLMNLETQAMYYSTEIPEESFGGVYFDNNRLIVNIVDSDVEEKKYFEKKGSDPYIEFRTVKNSLQTLENVKDFLTDYMNQYEIHVLDANEVTNEVDIFLANYEDGIICKIQKLVEEHFPGTDFLNFIDNSGVIIQATVAYECPIPKAEVMALPLKPGMMIQIGEGYYTLGPTTSSSTALSAGHGFRNFESVYLPATLPLTSPLEIGTAESHFGGKHKDWSSLSINSSFTCTDITHSTMSITGYSVTMVGAVSGETTGKITKTNVSVAAPPPYAPLTGMCEGDYLCALGDSGAGIFTSDFSYYYGVQSSATFNEDGTWAGKSYFSPLEYY